MPERQSGSDPSTAGLVGFALLLSLQLAGEWLSRVLALPMPGPVLGMLLLLPLLGLAQVRAPVGACAQFLLNHLSLLFIPVGVGLVTHLHLMAQNGLKVLVVLIASTLIGLAVTAFTFYALARRQAPQNTPGKD
jgi:holin-like protein